MWWSTLMERYTCPLCIELPIRHWKLEDGVLVESNDWYENP